MVSSPSPPDPAKTAAAQGAMNRETAITQQQLNMTNQYNPWGSVEYAKTGTQGFQDSKGNWIETPTYSQTTTLSPEQQAIFDQTQAAQSNMAGIAQEQSSFLQDYLGEPFEFNNQDAANWAYDLGAQRLDPRFAQQQQQLETDLVNRGIRPGSAAYDQEMARFEQTRNDAYNQLQLTGRSQAFSEAQQTRSQPINELTALLSGSQITNPGTQSPGTPQTGVAGVDYTGLVNQQYQGELAQSQAAMGGMFGLAAAPFAMFSDRRLKSDIKRVGTLDNGIHVYSYRMGKGPTQIGIMAQEVEMVRPEAVHTDPATGFLMVDYAMATEAV